MIYCRLLFFIHWIAMSILSFRKRLEESKDTISGICIRHCWTAPRIHWMRWNTEYVGKNQLDNRTSL